MSLHPLVSSVFVEPFAKLWCSCLRRLFQVSGHLSLSPETSHTHIFLIVYNCVLVAEVGI